MKCTKCGSLNSYVAETRNVSNSPTRRRRVCSNCGLRFTTREISENEYEKYKTLKKMVTEMNKIAGTFEDADQEEDEEESETTPIDKRTWNTLRCKEYRKRPGKMKQVYASTKKYQDEHPDRLKAWQACRRDKETMPCVICGAEKTHRHHPDPLKVNEIIYLCPLHHRHVDMGKIPTPLDRIVKI